MPLGRRFLSSLRWGDVYSSPSQKSMIIKTYTEYCLKEYCAKSGLDAQGAHIAWIKYVLLITDLKKLFSKPPRCRGGPHEGGTVKGERFHFTFKLTREDGSFIPTTNPYTRRLTNSHHFYIANNTKDLEADASSWFAATNASAADDD